MAWIDGAVKLVRDHDAAQPRSTQISVGWSEVGGCRAYLGFRLDGAWPTDDTDTWGAQRGTAIHAYLLPILAGPGARMEVETTYRGIPGHADLVEPDAVTDLKTTRLASSKLWAEKPHLLRQKRVQAHGYAAGLIGAGELPEDATVRLLVVPVDGTFADWWAWEEPFDRALADEGADRLEDVRERMAAGETPPKDEPYAFCSAYCQFFSICRSQDDPEASEEIVNPELAAAIAAYGEANAIESAAKKDKERLASLVRGLRGTAGDWRISLGRPGEGKPVIDENAVREWFGSLGEPVPMTMKPGNAPRLSVTRIKRKDVAA